MPDTFLPLCTLRPSGQAIGNKFLYKAFFFLHLRLLPGRPLALFQLFKLGGVDLRLHHLRPLFLFLFPEHKQMLLLIVDGLLHLGDAHAEQPVFFYHAARMLSLIELTLISGQLIFKPVNLVFLFPHLMQSRRVFCPQIIQHLRFVIQYRFKTVLKPFQDYPS